LINDGYDGWLMIVEEYTFPILNVLIGDSNSNPFLLGILFLANQDYCSAGWCFEENMGLSAECPTIAWL